jgi:hypothetical protein
VVSFADVVIIGNKSVDKVQLSGCLRPDQVVIDLVNLDKQRRVDGIGKYEGICW